MIRFAAILLVGWLGVAASAAPPAPAASGPVCTPDGVCYLPGEAPAAPAAGPGDLPGDRIGAIAASIGEAPDAR